MPVARNFFRVLCRSALVEWVDEEGVLDVVPAKLMVSEIRVEDVAVGMLFFFLARIKNLTQFGFVEKVVFYSDHDTYTLCMIPLFCHICRYSRQRL